MNEMLHPRSPLPFEEVAVAVLLDTTAGRQITKRVDDATTEYCPDRNVHIRHVALTVMRAKGLA